MVKTANGDPWRSWRPWRPWAVLLRHGHELHAHAAAYGDGVARLLAGAGLRVEFPHADLAAVLAGDQHPPAARVHVEVPRRLDVAGDVPGGGEPAVRAHREHRDAVVPAV